MERNVSIFIYQYKRPFNRAPFTEFVDYSYIKYFSYIRKYDTFITVEWVTMVLI